MVERVGGITTPHRGSIRFQISGIEDDALKIGVEAYVLNKVTKDLHLHPIPLALKWDPISEQELADPEFRTPARIDLLLGVEVFTCILRDGRRTGPRGTPSAINTGLGWVIFGKILDRDVVDVGNQTLEQDELEYMSGSGRPYAAVVTAEKKNDLRSQRRRNGRMAKAVFTQATLSRAKLRNFVPLNLAHKSVPFTQQRITGLRLS